GIEVKLTPTITMKSGAYAGTSFAGATTSVALNGFSVSNKEIGWDSSAGKNAYPTTDIASLIPTNIKNLGTAIIEVRALTNATKVIIADDGTASPTISIDKTINVQQAAGGSDVIVKLEFIVSFAGSDVEYYGVGGLAVMPITPSVAATLNGENSKTADITAGASFGLSLAESHGLEITNVTVGGLEGDEVLSYAASGANIIFTAADVTSSTSKSVDVTYYVNGISYTYTFTANISPRGDEGAFTVTNETVTIATSRKWLTYTQSGMGGSTSSQTTFGFVTEWTASDSNQYTIPYYLYVRPYSGNISNTLAYIKVEAFNDSGTRIGNVYENSNIASNSSYLYVYLSTYVNQSARRIRFTIGLRNQVSQFTLQYMSRATANGAYTSTSKIYRCLYSNYVPVTLDVNAPGAEISSSSTTLYYTSTYSSIAIKPTRSGYDFKGWYFDKECTQSASGTTVYGYSNTVYAKWDIAKYTVTFDYNGGKVGNNTSSDINETYGQNYVVPATNPTRSGYSFVGWYTEEGNRVTSGTVVPASNNSSYTVSARWVANTYTVTFNNAGLDAFSSQKTVTFDSQYGTLPEPTRAGYSFGGWYTSDVNQTEATKITSSSKVSNYNNHNLYAKWEALSYQVTLIADGGTISTSTYTVHFAAEYGFMNTPTRDGYTFNGWYTEPDGAGVKITNELGYNTQHKLVEIAADHNLYASWTANEYTVVLSAIGATGSPDSITVVYGGTYAALKDITPVKTGYTFVEWHDGLGNVVTKDTKVTVTSNNTTLVAVFKANTYTVTFKNAELDAFSSQKTVTYASEYGTLPTPTKAGYTFDGWYTSNAYTTKVEENSTVNKANDHELYAKWTAQTYTVKFYANGGTLAETTLNVTYGEKYSATAFAEPTREGYVFKGWYTDPFTQTDATRVTNTSDVAIAADHILYAKWEVAPEPEIAGEDD
ncbi:MAG: InlB B-repeat-containing protein, partial [Clostridiales bacterium]|nr:InlB B-repeat-containing protein [Clostridiales bacterium]